MYPQETLCSNCKLEIIYQRWHRLLLNWLNLCIGSKTQVINYRCLLEIVHKYCDEICTEEIEKCILCQDDIEPFLQFKYPILRLRYLSEEKDLQKRIHLMATMLLYHCCMNSTTGLVEKDICRTMNAVDKEMIVKFCENLNNMEATINNVETAIRGSIEYTYKSLRRKIVDDINVKTSGVGGSKPIRLPKFGHNQCTCSGAFDLAGTSREGRRKQTRKSGSSFGTPNLTDDMSSSVSKSSVEKYTSETSYDFGLSCEVSEVESLKEPYSDKDVSIYNVKKPKVERKVLLNNAEGKESTDIEPHSQASDTSSEQQPVAKDMSIDEVSKVFDLNTDVGAEVKQPTVPEKVEIAEVKVEEENKIKSKPTFIQRITLISSKFVKKSSIRDDQKRDVVPCQAECACTRCSTTGPCCGDPNGSMAECHAETSRASDVAKKDSLRSRLWETMKKCCIVLILFMSASLLSASAILGYRYYMNDLEQPDEGLKSMRVSRDTEVLGTYYGATDDPGINPRDITYWNCANNMCQKISGQNKIKDNRSLHLSQSRCILLCTGPQLWPTPIGQTSYSRDITAMETRQMDYKFESTPSDAVARYLSEAFRFFITDLARLERVDRKKRYEPDMTPKKMSILISVLGDKDPRLRLDTEESYELKIDSTDNVYIKISSESFCGVRHGLETLSQLIVLDQATGFLITYSNVLIKDSPTFKYRGLMIDTARNYVPVEHLIKTVDAMASCKLNTFHWRISDAASFPLVVDDFREFPEYGAYRRDMVYTKNDVKAIVSRAGIRGIRVLIEIAAPGPVGRAWSWSANTKCPNRNQNNTCENILCLRLKMENSAFDILQKIYAQIINMTKVDDVFHLSDGIFSLATCQLLIDDRQGFLDKALERLKLANKGFLPKLPIVWYNPHLYRKSEAQSWERFGVQLHETLTLSDHHLNMYRVIHSSKWDLSCEIKKRRCYKYKPWQELYRWNSWRNMDSFTVEGGEAILWTDFVNPSSLDYILWPRAAAVAERLWSDLVAKRITSDVYLRLDSHRWRMILKGINVQPIWPIWCNFNPQQCLDKIKEHSKV